jgi:membrane protein DedA with SNARE-associated domain
MLTSIPSQLGYGALFALVLVDSAGVPAPGEAALVAAGLLARTGELSLPLVIAAAALAAALGDNLAYWLGRRGGRAALVREGRFAEHGRRGVVRAERFFERHGDKTVFLSRWVTGVRSISAVLAGASRMPWRTFVVYDAAGALAWSATVGGAAALLGPVAAAIVITAGLAVAVGTALVSALRARRRRPRVAAAATG